MKLPVVPLSCVLMTFLKNEKNNYEKDVSHLKIIKLLHIARDTRKRLKKKKKQMKSLRKA